MNSYHRLCLTVEDQTMS